MARCGGRWMSSLIFLRVMVGRLVGVLHRGRQVLGCTLDRSPGDSGKFSPATTFPSWVSSAYAVGIVDNDGYLGGADVRGYGAVGENQLVPVVEPVLVAFHHPAGECGRMLQVQRGPEFLHELGIVGPPSGLTAHPNFHRGGAGYANWLAEGCCYDSILGDSVVVAAQGTEAVIMDSVDGMPSRAAVLPPDARCGRTG